MKINIALWYYFKYKVSDIWYFYFIHVINIVIGKCPMQIKRKCDMTNETKTCPFCGEEIMVTAKKCKHCGEWLDKQDEKQKVQQTKVCPVCGETILASTAICEHCGEKFNNKETHSKLSDTKNFPDELKKFNWGAFLVTWIWGLGNNVRISLWSLLGLLAFIPAISIFIAIPIFAFQIWLGINGNKLAWGNNQWDSVEQFNTVQKKWAMWSAIITVGLPFIISFSIAFTQGFLEGYNKSLMGY